MNQKEINMLNEKQLAEKIDLLKVITLKKKFIEQMEQLTYESFYEIVLKSNDFIIIGIVDNYKCIIVSKKKYYWIHRNDLKDYIYNNLLSKDMGYSNKQLHNKAYEKINILPQLFEN